MGRSASIFITVLTRPATQLDPRRLECSLYAYSELFLHEDMEVSVENQKVAKDSLTVVLSVNTYPALS